MLLRFGLGLVAGVIVQIVTFETGAVVLYGLALSSHYALWDGLIFGPICGGVFGPVFAVSGVGERKAALIEGIVLGAAWATLFMVVTARQAMFLSRADVVHVLVLFTGSVGLSGAAGGACTVWAFRRLLALIPAAPEPPPTARPGADRIYRL